MVKVALVKIIKQICELAYNCKDYSNKADVKNNVKMNRNSAFNGRARATKNLEIKKIGLDELNRIKAKEKRRNVIQGKHHEVAYADHIESGLTAVSPENVRKSVKNQQEARDDLQQNQRPPAVVLNLMPRQQKDSALQAEKAQPKKKYDADYSNCITHIVYEL